MKVGDLVKTKATCSSIGIITLPEIGGWWIRWACGAWGFHIRTDLEVISESR